VGTVPKAWTKDAAARRKRPTVYKGVDLEQEAWRYCQALGYKRNVELQVVHSARLGSEGRQWLMVTKLTIGYEADLAHVLETLLHEICHATHMDHSEAFISLCVHAARDIWGITIDGWDKVEQGKASCRAYAVDEFLRHRLAEKLAAGEYRPVQFTHSP